MKKQCLGLWRYKDKFSFFCRRQTAE